MKKIVLSVFFLLLIAITSYSQVPNAISYQAVVRNSTGEVITNQDVSFRISILQGTESGSSVYSETHNVTTNSFGLANLQIGLGTIESGIFDPGGWGLAAHFLKIEFDPSGGSDYIHMGTSQLLSVPYAFHAKTVEIDNVDDADNDPENELQTISLDGTELTLSDGGSVSLPSPEGGDNWGTQAVVSDATLNGNGSAINPLTVSGDLTDDQTLSITDNDLTISEGNTVTLPEATSLWQKNYADEIYYNLNVGIGTTNPQFELDIYDETTACIARIKSEANNAMFCIDRKALTDMAYTSYTTSDVDGFYTGLLGNDNYRISSDIANLKGLEVNRDGDVNLSGDLLLGASNYLGIGVVSPSCDIDILGESAGINLKATGTSFLSGNAFCIIDKASTSKYAEIFFCNAGIGKFVTGLLGNDNYRISTSAALLNGIEVESDGDVVVSDEIHTSTTGEANLLPYAYGTVIYPSYLLEGNTTNVTSVNYVSTGQFKVNISNLGSNYTVMVCPSHNSTTAYLTSVVISKTSNYFIVAIWNTKADTYFNTGFSFIVYKP